MELVELNNGPQNQGNENEYIAHFDNQPPHHLQQQQQQQIFQHHNAATVASAVAATTAAARQHQQQLNFTNYPPPQLPPPSSQQQRFQQQQQLQNKQQVNSNFAGSNGTLRGSKPQQHQHQPIAKSISKHRELPVDVPDSFVGVAKQAPKYPPPKSNRQMPLANGSSAMNNNTNNNNNIHHHQHHPQHQVHQNSGLRDSIKLKQLEKPKNNYQAITGFPIGAMQPAVNKAFELDEDDLIPNTNTHSNNQYHNIPAQQQHPDSNIPTSKTKAIATRQQPNIVQHSIPDLTKLDDRLSKINNQYSALSHEINLSKLLSIYSTILTTHSEEFKIPDLTAKHSPTVSNYNASELMHSIRTTLRSDELTKDAAELLDILSMYQTEGIVSAFDQITSKFVFKKESRPSSPQDHIPTDNVNMQQPINTYNNNPNNTVVVNPRQQHQNQQQQNGPHLMSYENVPMDIENNTMYHMQANQQQDLDVSDTMSIKTVRIDKSSCEALGATIRRDDTTGSIIIARLLQGGAAIRSGLLHEGDEILEVNNIKMTNRSTDEVVDLLKDMEGTLDFTIGVRNYARMPPRIMHHKIHVKAFFNYQGNSDGFNPCKELSMNFKIGDVLCIVDQSDPNWWQATEARFDDQETFFTYLIPSVNFIRQRERILNDSSNVNNNGSYFMDEKNSSVSSLLFNCGKRKKKSQSQAIIQPDEVPLYEEVYAYYPTKFFRRPIILIGPNLCGRREILRKLLQDSNRFASAIPHTSKPMRSSERDGDDFHFVSRAQFEEDIKAGKFIEFGEFEKHYYGTSFDAIKEIVDSKKTCVHLVNGPSILNFRLGRAGRELKPFFVFIKPHSQIEKLKKIVDLYSNADLQRIIDEAQAIEDNYLPYFDKVITVSDIEQAYQELLKVIKHIEDEPQWIPQFWQNPSQ